MHNGLRERPSDSGVAVRVPSEAGDHGAMASGLFCSDEINLAEFVRGLHGQTFGDGDGAIEIGEMRGAFAMFERDLEG